MDSLLTLAGTVAASPGTTYYVNATGGNDGNTGLSEAQAWQTITHAVNTVPAGASAADPNIIQVAAGTYLPNETFPITFNNASIRLSGAGAATTIIDGGGATTILDINANWITIEDFTITNGTDGIFSDDFGGFSILDNRFTNLSDGVNLTIDKDDLTSAYTVDTILIRGNTFNITDDGVFLDIDLDYDDLKTGLSATIGDIDVLDNVFNMVTTDGIDMYIGVTELDDGSVSIGDIDISSGNEFYGGSYGVYFDGYFNDFTDTTVTVGTFMVNDNTFENQTTAAIYIDSYYQIEFFYGTTTATFGVLEFNRNDITSVESGCDGIYVAECAYWEYFCDDVSASLGNIYIDDNVVDVDGKGIYFVYYYTEYYVQNAKVTLRDLSIQRNNVTSGNVTSVDDDGIYVGFYDCGYDLHYDTEFTVGDVRIVGNAINASNYGIYLETDDFGYGAYGNAKVTAGDFYILENEIESGLEGIYVKFYDTYDMADYAEVTIGELHIEGNEIDSEDEGIYLYYDGFGHDMDDYSQFTAGNVHIEGNEINASLDGIYLYYDEFGSGMYAYSTVTAGDVYIQGNGIDAGSSGIYLYYYETGYELYDASEFTTGAVHIGGTGTGQGNTIDAGSEAIYIYYDEVAYYMDEDDFPCEAKLLMGDIYVQNNELSGDSDGIYMYYEDYYVGYYMYDDAYAELPDYVITGNTFNVTGDGIYLYTYENPYEIYDDAIFDFGGALIDGNTFNPEDVGMDYGIYFEYSEFCYDDSNDRSASIIGEVTITNNRFYDLGDDAISIYYNEVGTDLEDESTLDVGDLVIADNLIENVTASDGIDVSYSSVYSYDASRLTMGMLDILRNEISNASEDGIHVNYSLDAYDNSTQTIGRARIQRNTIDACGDAGVDLYMSLTNDTCATVNLGNPLIEGNTISNCADGITFEDVENATIRSNLLVNNTPAPSGVHLNPNSVYNQIFDNCFIGNLPYQAVDDGTNNTFDRNFWDEWIGSGPYNISGTANNTDDNPRDECRLGEEPPVPAQVPALTPAGLIALVSALSVVLVLDIVRRRKREE